MFKFYIVIVLAVMTAHFFGSLLSYLLNRLLDKLIGKELTRNAIIKMYMKDINNIIDEAFKDFPKSASTAAPWKEPQKIDYSKPCSGNKPNS